MDVPGVALRDQQISFDITAAEAQAASDTQRARMLDTLRALEPAQWQQQSRCSEWTVQDVARHVVQMIEVVRAAVSAAERGEKYTPFKDFDPKVTPTQLVRAAGEQSTADTLADFERSSSGLAAALGRLSELGDDDSLLVVSPAGRQPWPRSILHALFDASVHERDIAVPLGVAVEAGSAELAAIAAYQVLLSARIACAFGAQFAAELALTGAPALTVRVEGPAVSVRRESGTGAPIGRGDAIAVLDAMTGRGELPDVLDASDEIIFALSALRSMI